MYPDLRGKSSLWTIAKEETNLTSWVAVNWTKAVEALSVATTRDGIHVVLCGFLADLEVLEIIEASEGLLQ